MPARFISLLLAGCLAVDPALASAQIHPFPPSAARTPGCFLESAIPDPSVWSLRQILRVGGLLRSRLQSFLFYPDHLPGTLKFLPAERTPPGKLRRFIQRLESPVIKIRSGRLHKGLLALTAVIFFASSFSPATGLIAGFAFTLLIGNPDPARIKRFASKFVLPISIIGLGAGMDLKIVALVGAQGFLTTLAGISVTMVIGTLLGRRWRVNHATSFLISWGTAICGASAIAAMKPFFKTEDDQDSVALSAIFILNSLALYIFPLIGHWAGLTSAQFGYWCALAIHDTSSVVAAARAFSEGAMILAVNLKLARALWIVPGALAMGLLALKGYEVDAKSAPKKTALHKWGGRIAWFFATTWFMFGYLMAAAFFTKNVQLAAQAHVMTEAAKHLFVMVLFLIGTGLSVKNLSKVGWRPYRHAAVLWLIVSAAWLGIITQTRIADLPFLHSGSSQVSRPLSGRTSA